MMTAELFVYGVPMGADTWKAEDKGYFDTFYNNTYRDVANFLDIQSRRSNGTAYCYYNYLVYKNVVDKNGRPGSFFGITMRIDSYCKEIAKMYSILDNVYNAYVMGKILVANGTNLRYTISTFSEVTEQLKEMEVVAMQMVTRALSEKDFESLQGFQLNGGTGGEYNLCDCVATNIRDEVKQLGNVAISPFFPTHKEKTMKEEHQAEIKKMGQAHRDQLEKLKNEYGDQLEKNEREYAGKINTLSSELTDEKGKSTQLQKAMKEKDALIEQLQNSKNKLEEKLKRLDVEETIKKLIFSLQPRICDTIKNVFKEYVQSGEKQLNSKHCSKREGKQEKPMKNQTVAQVEPIIESEANMGIVKETKHKIELILTMINFILLVGLVVFACSTHNDDVLEKRFYGLEQGIATIQSQLKVIPDKGAPDNDNIAPQNEDFDINIVKIDLKGYSGSGPLTLGKEYVVNAINGAPNGVWTVDGADITQTGDPNTIKITPIKESVTITYQVGNIPKKRQLNAK